MIFRTAYVSHSMIGGLGPELIDIARVSLNWNAAHDVTGVLYFDRTRFFQLLEGPEDAVRAALARIARDPRHAGLRVTMEAAAARRVFPGQPLKFLDGEASPALRRRFAAEAGDAPLRPAA